MAGHRLLKIFVIILSLTAGLSLSAQTYQGTILGTVTDQSGAVLPGATITITNTGTKQARSLTSNAAGEYSAPNLEPGTYSLTVEAPQFRRVERPSVSLEVARTLKID